MTFLRYFIPLTIEGNKRGAQSCFYIWPSHKYNCAIRHRDTFADLAAKYKVRTKPIEELQEAAGLCFFVEGVGLEYSQGTNPKQTKTSITSMTDYQGHWEKYWDKIDYCLFPSRWFAEAIKKQDDKKSLLLGSPKYDLTLNKEEVLQKYNLKDEFKYALVLLPRSRDSNLVNLNFVYNFLRQKGYKIITKTRGKDNYKGNGDFDFIDASWFPHDSMELMKISDLVINFDSTCVKECVMAKKKIINFNIKPWPQRLLKLYGAEYSANIKSDFWNIDDLNKHYERIMSAPLSCFQPVIDKYLFKTGSSARILDYFNI